MSADRIAVIVDKLARLRAADPGLELFGAAVHRYALEPPLDEPALVALEARLGVALPGDYRDFLARAGVAGAGPGYGLLPPQAVERDGWPRVVSRIEGAGVVVESGTPLRPGFGRPSSAARPFLLDEELQPLFAYDPPPVGPAATPYDGCLELCDHGCGYFDLLVVNGPRAGEVWSDTMAAVREGRLAPTGRRFLDWYEAWLDDALGEAGAGA